MSQECICRKDYNNCSLEIDHECICDLDSEDCVSLSHNCICNNFQKICRKLKINIYSRDCNSCKVPKNTIALVWI